MVYQVSSQVKLLDAMQADAERSRTIQEYFLDDGRILTVAFRPTMKYKREQAAAVPALSFLWHLYSPSVKQDADRFAYIPEASRGWMVCSYWDALSILEGESDADYCARVIAEGQAILERMGRGREGADRPIEHVWIHHPSEAQLMMLLIAIGLLLGCTALLWWGFQ